MSNKESFKEQIEKIDIEIIEQKTILYKYIISGVIFITGAIICINTLDLLPLMGIVLMMWGNNIIERLIKANERNKV